MRIELSPEEVEIVLELVSRRIDELGPEIHHTRTDEFREGLKQLLKQLEALQQRLAKPAA
jgi:hypothetical protein